METLKKNYEFKQVLNKGKYYSAKHIEAFLKKNNKTDNRIGIAISVKIAKATKRNRIKRLIRESYSKMQPRLEEGYDMVFLWKKKSPIEEATYETIQQEMEIIMKKSNLLKEIK